MNQQKPPGTSTLVPTAGLIKPKRQYAHPTLLDYGPVSLMTGSGDVSGDDGSGMTMAGMSMTGMMDMMM